MGGAVTFARDGHVVTVTLSHPGKLNAISAGMWQALATGFAAAVLPVSANNTITTDTAGLTAGEVTIPVAGGIIPAYRAMPAGGKLTIETSDAQVDDRYAADAEIEPGAYVMIEVSDTGVGMTPDV